MTTGLYFSLVYSIFAISLVVFFSFCRNRKVSYYISISLAVVIILYKIGNDLYYIIEGQAYTLLPFEYSHIIYYLAPILVLTRVRKLQYSAGILAFLAAIGYIFGALFNYSSTLTLGLYIIIKGLILHELLFLLSIFELFALVEFRWSDYWPFLGIVLAMTVYLVLLCVGVILPDYPYTGEPVCFQFFRGDLGKYAFGEDIILGERIFTIGLLLSFLASLTVLSLWINRAIFKRVGKRSRA